MIDVLKVRHLPACFRYGLVINGNLESSPSSLLSPWKFDRNTDGQFIKAIKTSGDLQHVVLMCIVLLVECTVQ